MSGIQQMQNLSDIINALTRTFELTNSKNQIQRDLFYQYIKTFQKFSQKLATLAQKINEQVLTNTSSSQQSIINIFQHLSNTLLRMADCAKKVSNKAMHEVFDPINVFSTNYSEHNTSIILKLKRNEADLEEKYRQLSRSKENYLNSSEKLEKQRHSQSKLMAKIESGDTSELEKFNTNIKKITQSINQNEQLYQMCVKNVNDAYSRLRKDLNQTLGSVSHNEESRISFCQKNCVSAITIVQDFSSCLDPDIKKKINQTLKQAAEEKPESVLHKKLNVKIALLATSKFEEEFISFEQVARRKRKKSMEEQNNYLIQFFTQVKETDKEIVQLLINPWFANEKNGYRSRQNRSQRELNPRDQDVDLCKEKIMSFQPYSFYFIEQVHQRVSDMTSFYCKLDDESFLLMLNIFQTITNNLDVQSKTEFGMLGIEFLYKMANISLRIMWRKGKQDINKGKPIELLCQQYGKRVKKFNDPEVLKKIYQYMIKKKATMKKNLANSESRGMINTFFTKGIASMIGRKKEPQLTEDQIFNCQQQITQLLANLQVPSGISVPFIKDLLGNSENTGSFEYLRGLLFAKKDQQQRQKIFYRTEVKQKKEEKMRKVIEEKKVIEYCIWLVAKKGFFGRKELNLRLLSSQFSQIHCEILSQLKIIPQEKWIHLIPLDKKVNYIEMKQIVAQNSVPSTIEQIITLDVNRSLPNHAAKLPPTILHSLLRTYAYFHKQISYCQGMNYIAGYLYIKTLQEERAYRIFEHMMQFRFKELFANQFQVLKVKMYQFERLLSIFHPEVSDHFKKQSITSECYIVSWMITLFASSYQYTEESYLIDVLWERFLIWGWREFYRFVLSLFNIYKEEIIELTYDKALHFLGEMGRSKMFLASWEQYEKEFSHHDVILGMEQYPITEEMLDSLAKEYKLS